MASGCSAQRWAHSILTLALSDAHASANRIGRTRAGAREYRRGNGYGQSGKASLRLRRLVYGGKSMRKLLTFTAAAVIITAPVTHSSAAPDAAYHYCSSFKASQYTIRVYATNVTCRNARMIQREWWLGPPSAKQRHGRGGLSSTYYTMTRFPGWKCTSGSGGGSCNRGNRSAGYQN